MTRKQLVEGLRALHEADKIVSIQTSKRTGNVQVEYVHKSGLTFKLIITSPNATEQRLQTKPK